MSNPFRKPQPPLVRCEVCSEPLFSGPGDPLDAYVAGLGGWGGVPLAVHLGSWRNLWRKTWYHQECVGVYTDRKDHTGRWLVFGVPPFLQKEIDENKRGLREEESRGE